MSSGSPLIHAANPGEASRVVQSHRSCRALFRRIERLEIEHADLLDPGFECAESMSVGRVAAHRSMRRAATSTTECMFARLCTFRIRARCHKRPDKPATVDATRPPVNAVLSARSSGLGASNERRIDSARPGRASRRVDRDFRRLLKARRMRSPSSCHSAGDPCARCRRVAAANGSVDILCERLRPDRPKARNRPAAVPGNVSSKDCRYRLFGSIAIAGTPSIAASSSSDTHRPCLAAPGHADAHGMCRRGRASRRESKSSWSLPVAGSTSRPR